MKRTTLVPRALLLTLLVTAALFASSCDSYSGVGVGVGTVSRWGGSSTSPPVFVGGPSPR